MCSLTTWEVSASTLLSLLVFRWLQVACTLCVLLLTLQLPVNCPTRLVSNQSPSEQTGAIPPRTMPLQSERAQITKVRLQFSRMVSRLLQWVPLMHRGANSIAIGNGLLGVNGYPGSIGASSIAVGCGKAQAGAAQEISIGGTNSGTSALPLGLSVLPTSTVRFGPYTALVPTSPANSTQIGSGKVLSNQISLGSTGSGTGARGISADDTKCAFVGHGGTRQAEFGYWHCRTAGRTENSTMFEVSAVGPFTLTAAQMRNSWLYYTGAGASTMTTDTAVNILATLPAHQVDGDAFIWKCVADGGNVVLSAGVGVTLNDLTSLTADQVNATHTGYFLVQRTGAATVTISRIYTSYR